jgi:hypothetical protein
MYPIQTRLELTIQILLYRFGVFENRALRRILRPKREELTDK